MVYTSDDLLAGVRRLGYLPEASDLIDADLLGFANEEQASLISAAIKLEREEHYVTSIDYALDGVTRTYPIPTRAMGRMVRGIILVTPTGSTYPCPEVDPVRGWFGRSQSATAYCHSISGDAINLPGPGPNGWSLRVFYLRRPSQLVTVASAAAITKATDTTHITLANIPSAFNNATYQYFDIVRGSAPFDLMYTDREIRAMGTTPGSIAISGSTPIVVSDFVDLTQYANARQDYLCFREQTVYPAAPAEFFPALEAAVCRRALEALGDRQGVAVVSETYAKRVQAATDITAPRDESGGRAIVRRSSPLRAGGSWGRVRGRRWL